MPVTFHLVPAEIWEEGDPTAPYEPASLADEGFVHCTDGADELVATADRHLRDDPRPYLVLAVDLAAVGSPWRYDVPGSPYPHVYGPIDRLAVLRVTPIDRRPDGTFRAFDGVPPSPVATSSAASPEGEVDDGPGSRDAVAMTDHDDREAELDDREAELDDRERARDRRRDRDHTARARGLMRAGLAKGFKQILDAQARRAERAALADERAPSKSKSKDKDKRHP